MSVPRWKLWVGLILMVVTFSACTSTAITSEEIIIAEASQPVFALLYIAEVNGYFDDEGLDVTYQSFTSGRDALTSVVEGQADIATVYETPVVLRTYEGEALSVISSVHNSTQNTALVARKDHGIITPADLTGKTIAVSKNTNGEFFLFLYLTTQGLDLADITFVDTKPEEMVDVLEKGAVDAVAVWNPHLYNTQQAFKKDEIVTFYSDIYTEFSVLAGQREVVANKKEALLRLLRGLIKAETFLHNNEDKAQQIVIDWLSSSHPESTILGVWGDFQAEVKLDNVMLTIFEQEAQWFRDAGKYQTPIPNFREVIFINYLESIAPEAVTVYQFP